MWRASQGVSNNLSRHSAGTARCSCPGCAREEQDVGRRRASQVANSWRSGDRRVAASQPCPCCHVSPPLLPTFSTVCTASFGTACTATTCTVPQKLYFCEYDLAFFRHRHQMLRHLRKVKLLHPPGTEIYRNGNISMFEVGWCCCWGVLNEKF